MKGVKEKELSVYPDERGRLMEILRCDEEMFSRFGQVYVTTVYPGVVKAWHAHKYQWDYLTCIQGMVKLVLYDDREHSGDQGTWIEYIMGEHRPLLLCIPPGVWHGFKGLGDKESMILNCPTLPYNREEPDEIRLPPHGTSIPYDWSCTHG